MHSRRKTLLIAQFITLAVLVLWNTLGLEKEYYLTVTWWDMPAHVLGGLWAGLFTAWLFALFNRRATLLQCLLGTVIIGGVWELFEYAADVGASPFMSYRVDTAKDFINDSIGGAAAWFWIQRFK